MSAILVLIGFSLTVAIFFLVAFIWAVKTGQYDDRYTPSIRILFDDTKPQKSKNSNKQIDLKK
ncbi:MAG: cbb3-type cytochrome oxidase assembly protein CcoS [Melioribacteraceae bacterium]|nr:cbb3-type cytochrome oxidase assembly protein CcoS [Melioribacteraceae bacterium]